jgi:hypothetical protein
LEGEFWNQQIETLVPVETPCETVGSHLQPGQQALKGRGSPKDVKHTLGVRKSPTLILIALKIPRGTKPTFANLPQIRECDEILLLDAPSDGQVLGQSEQLGQGSMN